MRFLTNRPAYDLTYHDVFMAPTRSTVTSRLDVDLTSTEGINLPLRFVPAADAAGTGANAPAPSAPGAPKAPGAAPSAPKAPGAPKPPTA